MKSLAIPLACLAFLGCVIGPKNAADFKGRHKAAGIAPKDSFEIDRPFANVLKSISEQAEKGWNYSQERSSFKFSVGQPPPEDPPPWAYTCRTTPGQDEADISVQYEPGGSMFLPEGGYYQMVIEVVRTSDNRTAVTTYAIDEIPREAYEAIRQWANGKEAPAPILNP